jgi:transcriptional regulator with XRE-family HTH domain
VYSQSLLAGELRSKEYRDAFVASQIRVGLPMQCRALRESRDWTQPQLAEAASMSQPRISEIERPGERNLNLETLLRLASAFDVALQVRFVPFSQFVDDDDQLDLANFYVSPFEEDLAGVEKREEQMKSVVVMGPAHREASGGKDQLGQSRAINAAVAPAPRLDSQSVTKELRTEEGNNGISDGLDQIHAPVAKSALNAALKGRCPRQMGESGMNQNSKHHALLTARV